MARKSFTYTAAAALAAALVSPWGGVASADEETKPVVTGHEVTVVRGIPQTETFPYTNPANNVTGARFVEGGSQQETLFTDQNKVTASTDGQNVTINFNLEPNFNTKKKNTQDDVLTQDHPQDVWTRYICLTSDESKDKTDGSACLNETGLDGNASKVRITVTTQAGAFTPQVFATPGVDFPTNFAVTVGDKKLTEDKIKNAIKFTAPGLKLTDGQIKTATGNAQITVTADSIPDNTKEKIGLQTVPVTITYEDGTRDILDVLIDIRPWDSDHDGISDEEEAIQELDAAAEAEEAEIDADATLSDEAKAEKKAAVQTALDEAKQAVTDAQDAAGVASALTDGKTAIAGVNDVKGNAAAALDAAAEAENAEIDADATLSEEQKAEKKQAVADALAAAKQAVQDATDAAGVASALTDGKTAINVNDVKGNAANAKKAKSKEMSEKLPVTGSSVAGVGVGALLLILAGVGVLTARRRVS